MDFYNVLGYVGTFLYLLSYGLLNFNKIEGNSLSYIGINLTAAVLVCISLIEHWNGPSFAIQSSWIVFSIIGIVGILKNKGKNKDSEISE